jgi:hypothetical protein
VLDLVHFLVHRLNGITYSSCQGHRLSSGGWRLRNIGILCRDQGERLYLLNVLKSAAQNLGEQAVEVTPGKSVSEEGELDTIEITFLPQAEDAVLYFSSVDKACDEFLIALQREVSPPPLYWEIMVRENQPEIGIENVRRTFSDYISTAISSNNHKFNVRAAEPRYRNEALAVKHYARSGNIAIFNNHAWALAFWALVLGSRKDLSASSSFQIIHMDYHSDLMSPRMFYSFPEEGFIDFFTKDPVNFDREETIDRAIYSTAIGPGSFLLPFFYQQKGRRIRLDHIYPDPERETSDAGMEKEIYVPGLLRYGIEQDGPLILQQFGPTLALRREPEGEANLTISHLNAEGMEFPALVGEVIILDIDLDFFSNKMRGGSDWRTKPGWHPGEEELGRLMVYTRKLIEMIALSGVPVVVTIATSNDFCPSEIASATLQKLLLDLKAGGLIHQG